MDALIPVSNKPHAVCIPLPFQSHITAMLKLAKILHSRGFHFTFANTEYNHHRLLKSGGADSLKNVPTDFRFETISDGLPPSDLNVAPDIMALVKSVTGANGLVLVRDFLAKINKGSVEHPPVSCLVVDFALHSTLDADEEFGIPQVLLWAMGAAVLMIQLHGDHMVDKGYIPHDPHGKTTVSVGLIVGIVVGCVLLVITLFLVALYAVRQKKRAKRAIELSKPFASWAPSGKYSGGVPQLKGARWFS